MGEPARVLLVDVEDRVATVTLNRPDARNALSRELMYSLWDAITAAGGDPDVDAVVLTGADPAFCAGVDLKEIAGDVPPSAPTRGPGQGPERDTNGLYLFLPMSDKPIIGAINGVAVAGGLEMALQCTFLVASERARFADTHTRIGIMPGGGTTVLLTQSIGLRRAIEMSLTGNFLTAGEAVSLGLVNHVVPHEELLPFAKELAGDIVNNDQRGVPPVAAALPADGQRRHDRRGAAHRGLHGGDVAARCERCRRSARQRHDSRQFTGSTVTPRRCSQREKIDTPAVPGAP